jgi:hypothetical protein
MNVPRELAGSALLPSGEVLISGGLTGEALSCESTPSTPVSLTTNSSAEVYNPAASPPTWTLTSGSSATPGAAGGMSVPRLATDALFTSGVDAGMVITAGGVDVETSSPFPACNATTGITQTTQTATDLYDPATTIFTPTGALNQDREAYASALLNSGPNAGDYAVFGGACGNGTLSSWVIGTAGAATSCTGAAPEPNDYYEFYIPSSGTWMAGAAPQPATPANGTAFSLLH